MQRNNREFPATYQHRSSRSVYVACRRRCPFYREKLVSHSSCMLVLLWPGRDGTAAACTEESCCLLSTVSSRSCRRFRHARKVKHDPTLHPRWLHFANASRTNCICAVQTLLKSYWNLCL